MRVWDELVADELFLHFFYSYLSRVCIRTGQLHQYEQQQHNYQHTRPWPIRICLPR
jgi:hypothetical protein